MGFGDKGVRAQLLSLKHNTMCNITYWAIYQGIYKSYYIPWIYWASINYNTSTDRGSGYTSQVQNLRGNVRGYTMYLDILLPWYVPAENHLYILLNTSYTKNQMPFKTLHWQIFWFSMLFNALKVKGWKSLFLIVSHSVVKLSLLNMLNLPPQGRIQNFRNGVSDWKIYKKLAMIEHPRK